MNTTDVSMAVNENGNPVDDTVLLNMDACFTAFDRDGYVRILT